MSRFGLGFVSGKLDLPVKSGLALWFDASDAANFIISTGVAQWNDLSGNGRHLVQETGSKQPSRTTAGSPNGQNIVSFDGADDRLGVSWASVSNPITACGVARLRANSAFAAPLGAIGNGPVATTLDPLDLSSSGNTYRQYAGVISTGVTAINNVWYYFTCVLDAANSFARANGASIIGNGNTGSATASNYFIGASSADSVWYPLDVAELLYYTRALSSAEYLSVESYLKAKWGL